MYCHPSWTWNMIMDIQVCLCMCRGLQVCFWTKREKRMHLEVWCICKRHYLLQYQVLLLYSTSHQMWRMQIERDTGGRKCWRNCGNCCKLDLRLSFSYLFQFHPPRQLWWQTKECQTHSWAWSLGRRHPGEAEYPSPQCPHLKRAFRWLQILKELDRWCHGVCRSHSRPGLH